MKASVFLRELIDVARRALVDVDAAGDVAIEQERPGERDLVIFRARSDLQRHTASASPRPRKFEVWNDSCPKKPSNCDTPAPNVSWLRFCSSSFSVTSTLFFSFGVFWNINALTLFERLEVAQLVKALDAVFERLGVECAALIQPHLTANDVIARQVLPTKVRRLTKPARLPACASSRSRWAPRTGQRSRRLPADRGRGNR